MGNRSSALPLQRTYNVGTHGPDSGRDLQGIATLTHDTIAIDNLQREQNSQADNELEKRLSGIATVIKEVMQATFEATGVPKEAFED